MILDSLQNASKYVGLHPAFAKAFEYISNTDLSSIEPGKYEIDGDQLKATVFDKKGMTVEESTAKFECHNQYIDIQVCIRGVEKMGWKPRETCHTEKGPYNEEKDVVFYIDAPDMFFELRGGQFTIFFPNDVHAPMIGDGEIKKMVIKVKI
jgi:YhcH/YjgK/YiaL family protein